MKDTARIRAEQYFSLTHPERRNIVSLLSSGPKTPSEVINTLNLAQSSVSKHLNHLYSRGLILRGRRGRMYEYTPNPETLDDLITELTEWKQTVS